MERRKQVARANRRGTRSYLPKVKESDLDTTDPEPTHADDKRNKYFSAASEGILMVTEWLASAVIRRTMQSRDADGNMVIPPIPHNIIDSFVKLPEEHQEKLNELMAAGRAM